MEKELKVAELADIWDVSVPTTWNRVRKEDLKTVMKKDENGKEINYVIISDETIKKYINNINNNVNEVNNNGYYEELLSNNNVNNSVQYNNNSISSSELFDKLTTLNNEYNDRLERLNNELITSEKQRLLLEDKAGREGLYLNEIKGLETENNKLKTYNKVLFTILTIIISVLLTVFITLIIVNNAQLEETDQKNTVVQEVPIQPIKNLSPKRK